MSPENEPKPPASDEAGSDRAKEQAKRQALDGPSANGKPDEGTRPDGLTSENGGGSQG